MHQTANWFILVFIRGGILWTSTITKHLSFVSLWKVAFFTFLLYDAAKGNYFDTNEKEPPQILLEWKL